MNDNAREELSENEVPSREVPTGSRNSVLSWRGIFNAGGTLLIITLIRSGLATFHASDFLRPIFRNCATDVSDVRSKYLLALLTHNLTTIKLNILFDYANASRESLIKN